VPFLLAKIPKPWEEMARMQGMTFRPCRPSMLLMLIAGDTWYGEAVVERLEECTSLQRHQVLGLAARCAGDQGGTRKWSNCWW